MTVLVLIAAASFLAGALLAARMTRRRLDEQHGWALVGAVNHDLAESNRQRDEAVVKAGRERRHRVQVEQVNRQLTGLIIGERRPIPLGPRHLRRSPVPRYGIHRRRLA